MDILHYQNSLPQNLPGSHHLRVCGRSCYKSSQNLFFHFWCSSISQTSCKNVVRWKRYTDLEYDELETDVRTISLPLVHSFCFTECEVHICKFFVLVLHHSLDEKFRTRSSL
ncbi:hypothetical protein TNCV_4003101 [Trichonephila clavipes]|nr:hypothetical protein TNCV_4003101 [Trichonephila clavipes]